MFVAEFFTVKPDKIRDFDLPKKFKALIMNKPEVVSELKSWTVYRHSFGTLGGYVELSEFESFEDFQKWMGKMANVKEG